jgi:hypothetical protein
MSQSTSARPMHRMLAQRTPALSSTYGGSLLAVTFGWKYPIYLMPDGKIVTYGQDTWDEKDKFYWFDDPDDAFARKTRYNTDELAEIRRVSTQYRSDQMSKAVEDAKERRRKGSSSTGAQTSEQSEDTGAALSVRPGTWNDGSYTYVVKSATEAFVPETGVTFKAPDVPTESRWNKFVTQLNSANLKEGKATGKPKSSGGGSVAPSTVSAAPLSSPEESITDKVWFWPVAILVPAAAVIGGILLWPSKKKASIGAIPVASNPRRRRSKRSKR